MAKRHFDDDNYRDEVFTEATSELEELKPFLDDGLIKDVLYTLKSGKEATVYCCQAYPKTGVDLLAAKIYRSRNNRNFKKDTVYQEGRVVLNQRNKRALEKKTGWGREMQAAYWQGYEYETLQALYRAGAAVPKPYAQSSGAILMEFVGDHEGAAPLLSSVTLETAQARQLFDDLINNIQLWLSCNYIHADLSAFNILYWQDQLKVIDFPTGS